MKISVINLFLYTLFFVTPFIDAVTGVLVYANIIAEGGIASPSQLIKFFLFVFCFLLLNKKQTYLVVSLYLAFLVIESISFLRHFTPFVFIWGQVSIIKILTLINLFFVLYNYWNTHKNFIIKLYIKSALIYSVILLISFILGIGQPTYMDGAFGFKGPFASGNGLGFYLGSSLCIFYYIRTVYSDISIGKYKSLFIELILLSSTFLIGTKASFIFILLFFVMKFLRLKIQNMGIVVLLIAIILINYMDTILDALSVAYEVVLFRLNNSESIFTFIFSSRDDFVINAFSDFFKTDYLIRFFTGGGSILSFQNPDSFEYDTLESDLFDIFFMYGIILTILYLSIIVYLLYKSLKKSKYLFFIFSFVAFHSIMAGHVLFNAMSTVVVIILMLLVLDKKLSLYEEKSNLFPPL